MSQQSDIMMYTTKDIYRWYIKKMLKENPEYWTEYDQVIRQKGILVLFKRVNSKPEVHMTYTWFRAILEKNNRKARAAVIQGQKYSLGFGLGYLQARRVERDFSQPKVNVVATMQYRKENPGSKATIYYDDDHYIRIAWHRVGGVRNESVYEFKPCKDFRLSFSKANFDNPLLKFKYLYFPLLADAS